MDKQEGRETGLTAVGVLSACGGGGGSSATNTASTNPANPSLLNRQA